MGPEAGWWLCPVGCLRLACLPILPGRNSSVLVRTLGLMPPCLLLRLNVSIECKRVSGLEPATVDWAFDLTKTNMQTM